LSQDNKGGYVSGVKDEYEKIRVERAKHSRVIRTHDLVVARANRVQIDWQNFQADVPSFLGTKVFEDFPLQDLIDRIDWTPLIESTGRRFLARGNWLAAIREF